MADANTALPAAAAAAAAASAAAKRRELRRQKILANSESRMRRILNDPEDKVPEAVDASQPAAGVPEQLSSLNVLTTKGPNPANVECPKADAVGARCALGGSSLEAPAASGAPLNAMITEQCGRLAQRLDAGSSALPSSGRSTAPLVQFDSITSSILSAVNGANDQQPLPSSISSSSSSASSIAGMELALNSGEADFSSNLTDFLNGLDVNPIVQALTQLAQSRGDSLATTTNAANLWQGPGGGGAETGDLRSRADQGLSEIDRQHTLEKNRVRFRPLWDPSHSYRVILLVLIAIVARIVLPFLSPDYTLMFGPLYLIEVLSISLCILCAVPLDQSRMSSLYHLMLLFGAPASAVRIASTLSACLEIFVRDLSMYAFSFFITHALCQHGNVLSVTSSSTVYTGTETPPSATVL